MTVVTTLQTTDNSMKQFYQELLKNPELQAQLKTASNPESLCQMAVQLGAERGYTFMIEQARAAMAIEVAVGGDVLEEANLYTDNSIVALSFSCRMCK
jgi:Nif11 domain